MYNPPSLVGTRSGSTSALNGNYNTPAQGGGVSNVAPAGNAPASSGGVYWVGQDGNRWVADSQGTRNVGQYNQNNPYWDNLGYRKIDDPVAATTRTTPDDTPGTTPGSPGVGGGGGGLGQQFEDTTAARNYTQRNLDSLAPAEARALSELNSRFGRIDQQYTDEEAKNTEQYNKAVGDNESELTRNRQLGMAAGAEGSRGLYAMLASMNALGGTGRVLADRMVSRSLNDDLNEAKQGFDKNFTQLYNAYEDTKLDEKNRRSEMETAKLNETKKVKGDYASQRQVGFKDMADLWKRAGDDSKAAEYLAKAGGLINAIRASESADTAKYTARSAGFKPGELSSYLAGQGDMRAGSSGSAMGDNTAINNPLYVSGRKREERV